MTPHQPLGSSRDLLLSRMAWWVPWLPLATVSALLLLDPPPATRGLGLAVLLLLFVQIPAVLAFLGHVCRIRLREHTLHLPDTSVPRHHVRHVGLIRKDEGWALQIDTPTGVHLLDGARPTDLAWIGHVIDAWAAHRDHVRAPAAIATSATLDGETLLFHSRSPRSWRLPLIASIALGVLPLALLPEIRHPLAAGLLACAFLIGGLGPRLRRHRATVTELRLRPGSLTVCRPHTSPRTWAWADLARIECTGTRVRLLPREGPVITLWPGDAAPELAKRLDRERRRTRHEAASRTESRDRLGRVLRAARQARQVARGSGATEPLDSAPS